MQVQNSCSDLSVDYQGVPVAHDLTCERLLSDLIGLSDPV